MNDDQLSLLRELLRAGLSQAEVSRRLRVSRQRINQIVRKEGLAFVRGKPLHRRPPIAAMRAAAHAKREADGAAIRAAAELMSDLAWPSIHEALTRAPTRRR